MATHAHAPPAPEHQDVVIVGAGLSGIGAAYRLQTQCPGKRYAILEARGAIGGTWDLFRYPGVRSDSDMFTLGYPFRPWTNPRSMADGEAIRDYLRETASEADIGQHIRFRTKLLEAHWCSARAQWTLELETYDGAGVPTRSSLTCSFLYSCSGYYNYDRGHDPVLPGLEDFTGPVLRPQFWPENLDYSNKRVVVVGSGATAVTLVPAMAKDAAHVTMVQRSPSYVTALPGRDPAADVLRKYLPAGLAHRIARGKNIIFAQAFYQLCQRQPGLAKKLLRKRVVDLLGSEQQAQDHFSPAYNPWDQRLCVAPDGDFFAALSSGQASVVTDTIERFIPGGIRLASGAKLTADVVVLALGLSMLPLGGVSFTVDSTPVDLGATWIYRGLLVSGIPNLALCVGYTNASWTLRADLSSRYVCRLLKHMDAHGYRSAAPVVPAGKDGAGPVGTAAPMTRRPLLTRRAPMTRRPLLTRRAPMTRRPLLGLTAGYVQRAAHSFPAQGDRQPWIMRQNYLLDAPTALFGNLEADMVFDGLPASSPA